MPGCRPRVEILNTTDTWSRAIEEGGGIREGAWVAEATDLVDLSGWPVGTRLILRKERPHPGAQLRFTDSDGLRVTAFITDTPPGVVPGQLGGLELRHRQHARVEDRIRQAKATGLANLPCTGSTPRRLAGNHPGRNRSGGLDQTDRLPRPHRSGHLRDRHLPLPRPARRGPHHPRRPKGPLAHRRDLAVGHRDLPSMATTSGRLPLTTRPTRPYRPKETRPWKARPPSAAGRPVTPTCNNQHPNRVSANPPPPTTAARKIEARASCN